MDRADKGIYTVVPTYPVVQQLTVLKLLRGQSLRRGWALLTSGWTLAQDRVASKCRVAKQRVKILQGIIIHKNLRDQWSWTLSSISCCRFISCNIPARYWIDNLSIVKRTDLSCGESIEYWGVLAGAVSRDMSAHRITVCPSRVGVPGLLSFILLKVVKTA